MLTSLAPVKQPWWRWVNSSQYSTKKHNITKTNTENWESSRCQLKCRWWRRCHNGVDRWNSLSLKTKLAPWPFWIFNESQHIKTVCIFYGIYCICGKCVAYSLESEYHSPLSRLTAIEWYWVLTVNRWSHFYLIYIYISNFLLIFYLKSVIYLKTYCPNNSSSQNR